MVGGLQLHDQRIRSRGGSSGRFFGCLCGGFGGLGGSCRFIGLLPRSFTAGTQDPACPIAIKRYLTPFIVLRILLA